MRGQYSGYRGEPGVAKNSDVETFCALRLFIDSWRWEGVPWYLRSGKYLPETATEVIVELKPPPQRLFADSAPATGRTNYLRFRLSPTPPLPLRVASNWPEKNSWGISANSTCRKNTTERKSPYERLLGDAMNGDGALFAREDAVEAAWAVVDTILKKHHRCRPYKRGSWGPKAADAILAAHGVWHNPSPGESA